MLEGLRGEESIAALCRRERDRREPLLQLVEGVPGSRQEAACWRHGRARPPAMRSSSCAGKPAISKEVVAEQALELRILKKKALIADGGDEE